MNNYISKWHIFISGATQNRQQSTGLQKCWLSAKTNTYSASGRVPINTATTCFFPVLPWNHDWYTLARFIQINSIKTKESQEGWKVSASPLINIYAYSWGAGWGAVQLAKYLLSVAQYNVQNMVLTDPVYCSPNPFLRWHALFSSRWRITRKFAPTIVIPRNVKDVFWNRQYNNWPRAHSLSQADGNTHIRQPILETTLIHLEMDESPWFQQKVKELTHA